MVNPSGGGDDRGRSHPFLKKLSRWRTSFVKWFKKDKKKAQAGGQHAAGSFDKRKVLAAPKNKQDGGKQGYDYKGKGLAVDAEDENSSSLARAKDGGKQGYDYKGKGLAVDAEDDDNFSSVSTLKSQKTLDAEVEALSEIMETDILSVPQELPDAARQRIRDTEREVARAVLPRTPLRQLFARKKNKPLKGARTEVSQPPATIPDPVVATWEELLEEARRQQS
ncbi:hypothetical protein GOP47_0015648 [Adiantum capillus-veneris]|uniref:Uncharacterized protein n=1 Tax=Adiantum capillus-veneris TaxID=13818 RepID=A0A9D4UKE2_ADICA|nr:hypothetical protein GOP47_0015648 [Adiantum capillus-veneris]